MDDVRFTDLCGEIFISLSGSAGACVYELCPIVLKPRITGSLRIFDQSLSPLHTSLTYTGGTNHRIRSACELPFHRAR